MPRQPRQSYICTHCGKEFQRYASLSPGSKTFFCSLRCLHKHRTNRIDLICRACGKSFTVVSSRIKNGGAQCCSNKCRAIIRSQQMTGRVIAPRIRITCRFCDKEREVPPSGQNRPFCDKKCHAAWQAIQECGTNNFNWRGGYREYYGPNWREQRRATRKRDGYRCQGCHAKQKRRAFDVHHIKPFREFGYIPGENNNYLQANELTNLITLCPSCHKRAEHGQIALQPYLI